MRRRYYYVVNAFPPLQLGKKPDISYEEAREILLINISTRDMRALIDFQRLIDLRNVRALWLQEPLDLRGNFSEKELEEALLVGEGIPSFLVDFLQRYDVPEDRLRYIPSLFASLYSEHHLQGFNRAFYRLERQIRLVLTALRAKTSDRSLLSELQFEDARDPFIAELLAGTESKEFLVPQEYEALKVAFLENRNKPKELYYAVLAFRMKRLQELETEQWFGIDQVLRYLAQLILVEDWAVLDEKRGRLALEQVS
jgi:hypothetical protein